MEQIKLFETQNTLKPVIGRNSTQQISNYATFMPYRPFKADQHEKNIPFLMSFWCNF